MTQLLYPVGVQTFSTIREQGFLYVDKTEYIWQLVSTSRYVFLSRPRRFGKSLLLSTIGEYFSGHRELFQGLAISSREPDWTPHPVLHLDLAGCRAENAGSLDAYLNDFLRRWEADYGITTDQSLAPGLRFKEIIIRVHLITGRQVVILVDEYDKPLLETVADSRLQEKFSDDLRSFYSNLKSQDAHIRFAMLTGVTRFGHLSIFSDINNLRDISMDEAYSGICGVTDAELHRYFHPGVTEFASRRDLTVGEVYDKLRENYDGYHFSPEGSPDIYNPFSLLNAMSSFRFGSYWFQTGTPTSLIRLIRGGRLSLKALSQYRTSVASLSDVSFDLGNTVPVLYQSGYLTIKAYDPEFDVVTLGFPNREVEVGFFDCLMKAYASVPDGNAAFEISRFVMDVREGRTDDFMRRLQSLFADFQYDAFDLGHLERHYQDVIFIVMKLMGFYTDIEYKTASGRIDMVVKTHDYIYVFEFKIDKTAREALVQIDSRSYLLPFSADGRRLVKVGANFSSAMRTLDSWIIEEG